jgi:hypothetical protein
VERFKHNEIQPMKNIVNRRQFVKAGAVAAAIAALPTNIFAAEKKSVLVFTKSSGFEHDVVKRVDGKPSIVEQAITSLGSMHGFDVTATKDGRVFDSKDFRNYAAVLFFTTGDLTSVGTDKNPAMSLQGKQSLLSAIDDGLGFAGVHAARIRSTRSPIPRVVRTTTSHMEINPILICVCSAVNSSLTAARRGCKRQTSSSTIQNFQDLKAFPLP